LSLAFSYWTIKPWFLTEEKTCCYIHHLLLGFPNWPVIYRAINSNHYSGGKPQILCIERWRRLFVSFSSLGHHLGVDFAWGPVKKGLWLRLLAKGATGSLAMMMRRVEFGSRLGLG
jgi:hypothetical protein